MVLSTIVDTIGRVREELSLIKASVLASCWKLTIEYIEPEVEAKIRHGGIVVSGSSDQPIRNSDWRPRNFVD